MNVPFIDLTREYEEYGSDIREAIDDVLDEGYFVGGDRVESFESSFAAHVGSDHGIGVNSGSDALTLALRALGVGSGDEVIVPSHTFVSTANAVVKNGARPVFVDVEPSTLVIDPDEVAKAVTEDTAAIIPVHLYGHPAPMNRILTIARRHGFAVVEDASQAHGATVDGTPVGALGDVGCFSLYPTKNLGAYGDAGVAVTDDDDLAAELRSLRDYGRSNKYEFEVVANHSRLDAVQAAILDVKLEYLEKCNRRRREAANLYRERLSETDARPQAVDGDVRHVYHLFVVRHDRRDELRGFLKEQGVSTIVHYPIPVHQQPAYEDHDTRHDLSVTEQITSEIVSLPIHPWIRDEEVAAVADGIRAFERLES